MPQNDLEKNCILSLGFVRMMRLIIDISRTLQLNTDKIPTWQHIFEHICKPATLESDGEMLLQSYEGVIRPFPVWDKTKNARFRGLRANGAFLIN